MKKNNLCTSKKVLFSVLIFGGVCLVVILVGWLAYDRADAAGLAGVICAPVATVIGFYSWKAKHENIQKYGYKPFNENESEENISG